MSRHDALLAQLRNYQPAGAVEARHAGAMVNLLTSSGAFSRSHFEPGHFTASLYVIDGAGRLLLHHHRRLNRWLQMGGHVEGGETPSMAALREGREESGLADLALFDGILDLDVHRIPAGKGEPEHRHYDVRYLAHTASPGAIALDAAESNELAWFPLDRAEQLMDAEESTRVVRKIERLLRQRRAS